jgi:hypothetical protein
MPISVSCLSKAIHLAYNTAGLQTTAPAKIRINNQLEEYI